MDVLQEWCTNLDITLDQVAMIGDDVNDLPVLKSIGLSICPSNAIKVVREASDIILELKGGEGCVREFIDEYLPFEVEY
jgi:YrbI family 3-deoxy-D-manno-octulosonate 8-phosphate phosphatase